MRAHRYDSSRRAFLQGMLASAALSLTPACKRGGENNKGASGDLPLVAVSIFPLYDVVKRIAGDRLSVALVLPAGRSEHSYDPTPGEMARIAKAKLAISVGLGMDGWLEKIVQSAAGKDVPIVQLGTKANPRKMTAEEVGAEAAEEALDEQKEHKEPEGEKAHDHDHDDDHDHEKKGDAKGHQPTREHDTEDEKKPAEPEKHDHDHHGHAHAHGALDPHFWLDPVRMTGTVDAVVEAFVKLDAAGSDGFRSRGEAVKKSIDDLHKSIDSKSKAWTKKTIVTFHGSMGYFADRYGLKISAVIEPFPGKEPTPKYMKEVLAAIDKAKPAAMFSEPQLDKRPAQVIADQAKIPLFELDPVGGSAGVDSYEKLLMHNADVLDKALK